MLIQANALHIPLADESVHCCVTSPPYWSLRDYGTARWEGGNLDCDHQPGRNTNRATGKNATNTSSAFQWRDVCRKCGATRVDQQLGLESTPEAYVANLVAVFREVKRVLRSDGTLWLNIGDSYWGGKGRSGYELPHEAQERCARSGTFQTGHNVPGYMDMRPSDGKHPAIKPKDLCMIPARVALALQADGWWIRSDIIWAKSNSMPESVRDRPTRSHEYLFLLTKRATYYYDAEAIREPAAAGWNGSSFTSEYDRQTKAGLGLAERIERPGRSKRSVWHIATEGWPGSHFAVFPTALVKPCILAGTSAVGVCPVCGAGWQRVVDAASVPTRTPKGNKYAEATGHKRNDTEIIRDRRIRISSTVGWRPTCSCGLPQSENVPATVFDPFVGSGTTLLVARRLGRRGVGLDLSRAYCCMARDRVREDMPLLAVMA